MRAFVAAAIGAAGPVSLFPKHAAQRNQAARARAETARHPAKAHSGRGCVQSHASGDQHRRLCASPQPATAGNADSAGRNDARCSGRQHATRSADRSRERFCSIARASRPAKSMGGPAQTSVTPWRPSRPTCGPAIHRRSGRIDLAGPDPGRRAGMVQAYVIFAADVGGPICAQCRRGFRQAGGALPGGPLYSTPLKRRSPNGSAGARRCWRR